MSSTVVQSDFGPAVREGNVPRTIAYWGATGVVTIVPLLAAFAYLTTSPEAVENFRHVVVERHQTGTRAFDHCEGNS